jgi:hypothetical protein
MRSSRNPLLPYRFRDRFRALNGIKTMLRTSETDSGLLIEGCSSKDIRTFGTEPTDEERILRTPHF